VNPSPTKSPVTVDSFDRWFVANRRRVVDALAEFIALPTVSPDEACALPFLVDYVAGVGGVSEFLPSHPDLAGHWSRSPHVSSRMTPDRGSLRARLGPAGAGAPTTVFNCHVDVVPATPDFPDAFAPRIEGDYVWGRGACDTKNNLIMLVEAVRYLRDEGIPLRRTALLDLPIEEEIGGNGTLSSLLYGEPVDEAVCLEPTSLEVFRGHRGCLTFHVTVAGRSVHMGSGEDGIDAIRGAIAIIERLRDLETELLAAAAADPAFQGWARPLQLNIGVINGGEWSGSLPERCVIIGDLGFLPSTSLGGVERRIEDACRSVDDHRIAAGLRIDFHTGLRNDAYLSPADAPVVRDLAVATASVTGAPSVANPVRGWNVSCDARLYAKVAGVPTAIFGSGGLADAHSPHERVAVPDLAAGAAVLARFLSTPVQRLR
jgi:acetylornithine deacetylase